MITVLDINDEVPVFEDISYTATLMELTPPGSPVINVTAKDNDEAGVSIICCSVHCTTDTSSSIVHMYYCML